MGNRFWTPLDKRRKSAVGKINGLTQVMPETIAYAVVQVRVSFSLAQLRLD
jgi:hypothetical protein